MADVDAAFEQQILNLAQRKWIPDVHHCRDTDNLRQTDEIMEGVFNQLSLCMDLAILKLICSDNALVVHNA